MANFVETLESIHQNRDPSITSMDAPIWPLNSTRQSGCKFLFVAFGKRENKPQRMILSTKLFVGSSGNIEPSLFKRFIFFIWGSIFSSLILNLWVIDGRFTTTSITRSTSPNVIWWFHDGEWSMYAIPLFKKLVHLSFKIFRNS